MHLYIIRHAESANNELYATTNSSLGRHADPPLTERGHRQAQAVARYLAARPAAPLGMATESLRRHAQRHNRGGFDLTHLYCSLMVRAVGTGGYIAEATGLPLMAWPEIHERGGLHNEDPATGEALLIEGPGRAFFETTYPGLILPDTLGEVGWWSRPRETPEEFSPRARAVLAELLARHGDSDDRVGLVTHGGFFQSLMIAFFERTLGCPVPDTLRPLGFGLSNTGVTHIEIGEYGPRVHYVNKVEHLSDDLLSG